MPRRIPPGGLIMNCFTLAASPGRRACSSRLKVLSCDSPSCCSISCHRSGGLGDLASDNLLNVGRSTPTAAQQYRWSISWREHAMPYIILLAPHPLLRYPYKSCVLKLPKLLYNHSSHPFPIISFLSPGKGLCLLYRHMKSSASFGSVEEKVYEIVSDIKDVFRCSIFGALKYCPSTVEPSY